MSTSYKISGTIRVVNDTKAVSDKFSKRELVLDIEDGKYSQVVLLEFTGDKCAVLDTYSTGEKVEVEFNVRGREWRSPSGETKYFTTLSAWKIQRIGGAQAVAPSRGAVTSGVGDEPDDSIPFASCDVTLEPSPIARVLR
jgi:hypothetical protein